MSGILPKVNFGVADLNQNFYNKHKAAQIAAVMTLLDKFCEERHDERIN